MCSTGLKYFISSAIFPIFLLCSKNSFPMKYISILHTPSSLSLASILAIVRIMLNTRRQKPTYAAANRCKPMCPCVNCCKEASRIILPTRLAAFAKCVQHHRCDSDLDGLLSTRDAAHDHNASHVIWAAIG